MECRSLHHRACWVLQAVLFVTLLSCVWCQRAVKHLTSGTFEHDTQAATGQTAGPWCVIFSAEGHTKYNEAWGNVAHTQQREGDRTIQFGLVNVPGNTALATRFDINVRNQPSAFLFRNGKMYKFRSWGRKDLEAALTTFCTASEPSEPPQTVPVDNTIQSFAELMHFLRTTKQGWALVAGVLLIPLSFLILPAAVIYKILNSPSHPANATNARVLKAE